MTAFDLATDVIKSTFGETVTYKRGSDEVDLTAVREELSVAYENIDGLNVVDGAETFLIDRTDLTFDGTTFIEPKREDIIIDSYDGTYLYLADGGHVIDGARQFFEIKTKKVDV